MKGNELNVKAMLHGRRGVVEIGRIDFRLLPDESSDFHDSEARSLCLGIERVIKDRQAAATENNELVTFVVRLGDGRLFTFRGAVPRKKLPYIMGMMPPN